MKDAYASIIKSIGEDLHRPGLIGTPERAAKAMEFLTQGYRQNVDEIINGAMFPTTSNEMVIVKNIELYSPKLAKSGEMNGELAKVAAHMTTAVGLALRGVA